ISCPNRNLARPFCDRDVGVCRMGRGRQSRPGNARCRLGVRMGSRLCQRAQVVVPRANLGVWVYLVLAGIAGATAALNIGRSHSATPQDPQIYAALDRFGQVLEIVRDRYVEKPDAGMLIENAISGMLASLDPHSSYLNAKSYRDMQAETHGEFGGL